MVHLQAVGNGDMVVEYFSNYIGIMEAILCGPF
jgi:hypothetical protein